MRPNAARRGRTLAIAGLLILSLAPAHVAAAEADPRFKVAKEELLQRLKTIGVEPTTVSTELPGAAAVAARIDQGVADWLTLAGYEVVPASEMRPIEARARQAIGGLYDPMTGQLNREKAAATAEFVRAEYALSHTVDALLRVTVVQRHVMLTSGNADWDGVSESGTGESGLMGFLLANGEVGEARALSLEVNLTDPGGRLFYSSAGGVQLLNYVRRSLLLREYEHGRIDQKYVMTDPVRDRRGLAVALDGLARTPDSPARAKHAPAPRPIPAEGPAELAAKEITAGHPKIGLAPTDVSNVGNDARIQTRLGAALETRLAPLGFAIVRVSDYAELWVEERTRVGGFYDPQTGVVDVAKVTASRTRVLAVLNERYGVTALVLPTIDQRLAPFQDGFATWDGVTEMVGEGLMSLSIFGAARYHGGIEALSLSVHIYDQAGEQLYEGIGGLQLATKLAGANRVPVPAAKLFADAKHDLRAIDIAIKRLLPPKPPAN